MKLNLENKTRKELLELLDNVKISDAPIEIKEKAIDEINIKLNGHFRNDNLFKDIEESQADISDIS